LLKKLNTGRTYLSFVALAAVTACAVVCALFARWLASRDNFDFIKYLPSFVCVLLFIFIIIKLVPVVEWAWGVRSSYVDLSSPLTAYALIALWILLINAIFFVWAFSSSKGAGLDASLAGIWYRTIDADNYAEIAAHWYYPVEGSHLLYKIAFFPLYPLLMRAVQMIVSSYPLAGVIVSSVCAFMGGVMLYKLVMLEYGKGAESRAFRAVKYMLIFPSAFFFMVPMTESLYLFITIAFFYYLLQKNYAAAGMLSFLAALTRSQGLLLFVPFLFELISDALSGGFEIKPGPMLKRGAFILGAPLGSALYLLLNWQFHGNPFQFTIYQKEHWHNSLSFFWNTAAYLKDYMLGYIRSGNYRLLFGLSIPNIISFWGTLALILFGVKKRGASVTLYSLAYFIVSFGHGWLISGPRYAACLFPLALTASDLVEDRKKTDIALTCAYLLMFAVYLHLFTARYGVV